MVNVRSSIVVLRRRFEHRRYYDPRAEFQLDRDSVQQAGEALSNDVFSGGPVDNFGLIGRLYLITLLKLGLAPDSRVLDVGCGALRGGYWLIHFLNPGGYCGIEPNREMLEAGMKLIPDETIEHKQPRFSHNADFDLGVFGEEFDYVIARSIWTHTSKSQISAMLTSFRHHAKPTSVLLASYLRPAVGKPDYKGEGWVGRSHESAEEGIVRHDFAWIQQACHERDLEARELRFDAVDQIWLKITPATVR